MAIIIKKVATIPALPVKEPKQATVTTKPLKLKPLEKVEQDTALAAPLAIATLVDSYGVLEQEAKKALENPVFAQFEEVKVALKAELDKVDPELDVDLKGHAFKIHATAGAKKSAEITDMPGVRVALGDELFMDLVSITLANLRKYLTPAQLACVIDEETGRTLNRKLTVKHIA